MTQKKSDGPERDITLPEAIDFFLGAGVQVIVIDPGDEVLCDLCNEGYEDSDEKGGFLFSSNAVCPKCAPRFEKSAKEHGEEQYIKARAKDGETFRDFVYRIRREGL